jgi:hypothetical protein
MPFGGGTYWKIRYGKVEVGAFKSPVGTREYQLIDGHTYGKSANGTEIPRTLETKKEVLALINAIRIFN